VRRDVAGSDPNFFTLSDTGFSAIADDAAENRNINIKIRLTINWITYFVIEIAGFYGLTDLIPIFQSSQFTKITEGILTQYFLSALGR